MTSIKIIENKISFIKEQLKLLKNYQKYSLKIILNDPTLKGAVERYLYLAVQGTIDLAEAVISLKQLRKPTSYRENFYILAEEKYISSKLQESLIKMTGFRNAIVHAYEDINYKILYDVLTNRLKDITQFIKSMEKKLRLS